MTEDADLGIRLARFAYEVSVIDSVTMEEAPASWRNWRGQRTRWIKGWIQTYLVHMRRPLRLWRDLGAWRFAGFQLTIGATILSLLVHPWFYVLAAMHASFGERLVPESDLLLWVSGSNLVAGYGAAMLLTMATAVRLAAQAAVRRMAADLLACDLVFRVSCRARSDRHALLLGKNDARFEHAATNAARA